ncbi:MULTISPECIES: isobutyryl-CoA dehydrogenase [Hyphomonas]|uniref:Acyl-CoA dehydrogenase n=1 Tax=Hyphomonas adhaerens TaxID=81029 RepID=A0A3B9GZJ8_9PROT|nr:MULTISPECIES: isobutyryl-CoA dehydrogenase [Hyphomonas]MBB39152.1 acyl-CoA dehydrogenase [Hyphomonas sp.]HAE27867.1 acyl-CoA dehydrogenase [Hyphomonas adhaerens]|tara:strand:- start:123 stop:1262 length:1140 start_codon:yes stop_codon:yes gene_type:complete
MSALFSDEQLMIRDMARKFAEEELLPHSEAWDQNSHFPVDVIRKAAELGFASIYVKEDVGGAGLTRTDAALIFEQLAYGDVSTAAFISIHNMASWMIDTFGSDAQRQEWLPRLTSMELIASYCLTEPGAGSDAASLKTRAVRDGDDYVITGTKQFISGAGTSDIYVLMARTSDDGAKGVSTFIIPKDTPGLSFGANERKMGWKSQPTRQVILDGVRVPAANRVGEEGHGFKFAMAGLDGGRLNIAASALGGAQLALDKALAYAKERSQFGKAIADFQATQFKLADMETELQAARVMLYEAAGRLDRKDPSATRWCAMAKRFVTDTAFNVANDALQIHGGYGYLADYGVERIVRDLRVHQILEGTNEIMRVIISRDMLKD